MQNKIGLGVQDGSAVSKIRSRLIGGYINSERSRLTGGNEGNFRTTSTRIQGGMGFDNYTRVCLNFKRITPLIILTQLLQGVKSEVQQNTENNAGSHKSTDFVEKCLAIGLILWLGKRVLTLVTGTLASYRRKKPPPDPFYSFAGDKTCDSGKKHSITDKAKPNNIYLSKPRVYDKDKRFIKFNLKCISALKRITTIGILSLVVREVKADDANGADPPEQTNSSIISVAMIVLTQAAKYPISTTILGLTIVGILSLGSQLPVPGQRSRRKPFKKDP